MTKSVKEKKNNWILLWLIDMMTCKYHWLLIDDDDDGSQACYIRHGEEINN